MRGIQRVSITTINGHDEMALSQVNGAASLRYGDMEWGWLVCASELHHWRPINSGGNGLRAPESLQNCGGWENLQSSSI